MLVIDLVLLLLFFVLIVNETYKIFAKRRKRKLGSEVNLKYILYLYMYPISYLTIPLVILFFIDKQISSNFYPFIFISSVFGIIILLGMIFFSPFRKIFYQIFPQSLSLHVQFIKRNLLLFYFMIILSRAYTF